MPTTDDGLPLFELGQRYFKEFVDELARYDIIVDPAMELRRGKGMLCFYDLSDGHIYLSVPDLQSSMGQLKLMLLGSFLGCDDDEELMRFLRLFVPRLIAHEIGHHLRHRHGCFGDDMWHEEQIGNRLAVALTQRRLTPVEKDFARVFLRRAIKGLAPLVGGDDAATVTYHDVLAALNASGRIDDAALERMQVAQQMFSMKSEDFIDETALSVRFGAKLRGREVVIQQINDEYGTDYAKYMYYHAGWLYLDLNSHGAEYIDGFARTALGVEVPLLASIEEGSGQDPTAGPQSRVLTPPTDKHILSCYRAFRFTMHRSETLGRYFYKRYRQLLWARLQAAKFLVPSQAAIMKREASFFLESFTPGESDALGYLVHIAPPELRELFPQRIESRPDSIAEIEGHLPKETDRRLFRHVAFGVDDAAAKNTLARLTLLDQTDVFRAMPADSMLELCRSLCRFKLQTGQTIISEGEHSDDVFFLTQGGLDVLVSKDGGDKVIGHLRAGEVFGEMAFFSREKRNATVRAATASEGFVILDADLLRVSFKHPSILMQMAGALTRRLARVNRRSVGRMTLPPPPRPIAIPASRAAPTLRPPPASHPSPAPATRRTPFTRR
jgi:CRP-like cAMP-binding protein